MATTFSDQINSLAVRVGTECKTLHTKIGDLTTLNTTDKTSVVKAISEVKTAATTAQEALNALTTRVTAVEGTSNTNNGDLTTVKGQITTLQQTLEQLQNSVDAIEGQIESQTNINDETPSNTTTYSSNKINSVVTEAKNAVKNELLGGAGTAFDTLKELADLIQTNVGAIDALEAIAAGHVRFDQAQTIGDPQKTQARNNIGAASQTELTTVSGTATQAKNTADSALSKATTLETNVGNAGTDFVAAFESALEAS